MSDTAIDLKDRLVETWCSRFWKLHGVATVCFMAAALAGCGPTPTLLSGPVTLDGNPVEEAVLQFYPAAGDGQTSHAFADKSGKFLAKVSAVPLVVTIAKAKATGEKRQSFPDSPPVDVMEESLAPRYSDRRKTELRVTPIEGKTTVADFALTSDEK
jgi:hypothetical protein